MKNIGYAAVYSSMFKKEADRRTVYQDINKKMWVKFHGKFVEVEGRDRQSVKLKTEE